MKRHRILTAAAFMALAIPAAYAAQHATSGQMQHGMGDGTGSTMWNMGWGGSGGWGGLLLVVLVVLGVAALAKYLMSNKRG